jgi:hypothetical protein
LTDKSIAAYSRSTPEKTASPSFLHGFLRTLPEASENHQPVDFER